LLLFYYDYYGYYYSYYYYYYYYYYYFYHHHHHHLYLCRNRNRILNRGDPLILLELTVCLSTTVNNDLPSNLLNIRLKLTRQFIIFIILNQNIFIFSSRQFLIF